MITHFDPQIHFNWGYHDAWLDVTDGRPNKWAATSHPDEIYRQGYLSGWAAATKGEDRDSGLAWDTARAWGDV